MKRILLVRHGQSVWNRMNKFTGWTDVPITTKGIKESKQIAKTLQKNNLIPTNYYSSVLTRSIHTANIIKNTLNNSSKIVTSWKLNEKHYGSLEGILRQDIIDIYGSKFTYNMRNNFDTFPPIIPINNNNNNIEYPLFKNNYHYKFKNGESKQLVYNRVIPYYQNIIEYKHDLPIIISHKHCMRVIMKYSLNISDSAFKYFNIPEKNIILITLNNNQYESHSYISY